MIAFDAIGRLPHPDDNVAIATRTLEAGTEIAFGSRSFTIKHSLLEGHRFAVQPIHTGEHLLSWAQPFGVAIHEIVPGDYVCNEGVIRELNRRPIPFAPPTTPNFVNDLPPFVFDETQFKSASPLPLYADVKTFMGYRRQGNRGVGTRNTIVLLGTSAFTGGFVKALETRLKSHAGKYPNIDGIMAVAHTEGGHEQPNNRELLLRTLAGFMVNPNVGAVLAVDHGHEVVNNAALRDYLSEHQYPIDAVLHQFMSLTRSFYDDLDAAAAVVEGWLETVNQMERTRESISELKIGLQCGGSDAFSGVSGNPLLAWTTKEIVRYGGSANLAETDELIGAETYILKNVRDLDTARKFVTFLDRFKEWAGWHGHSAEGNPSGGNLYRGLYNIYLKSLGASTKKHPDVRLDYVIDYGEPMQKSGFYFMDSPGNDLESIAGQIASGCNLLFFVTGNGSITNFPFVPTIKIVTTTERFQLLSNEMDVNAGAYLDGTSMDDLGASTLQLTIDIASGQLSVGEKAGHAQVQIWRDWRQTGVVNLRSFDHPAYDGNPLPINTDIAVPEVHFPAFRGEQGYAVDQVGLILPTSLCSGQIAQMCVQQLNQNQVGQDKGISRFVTLVHTEGCGAANGHELPDTLLGYLQHPLVKYGLLLEHGCEKTHNGYIRQLMAEKSLDPAHYGWASVQADGGIHNVVQKMTRWFSEQVESKPDPEVVEVGLEAVRLGLISQGTVTDELAGQFANLTRMIVAGGGTVVIAENDAVLNHPIYKRDVPGEQAIRPTLGYAQVMTQAGFHIMAMPSKQWSETLTGLGAAGVDVILAHVFDRPMAGHPLIPVLQASANPNMNLAYLADLDAALSAQWTVEMLNLVVDTLARRYVPQLSTNGNTQFQITRGLLGVSL
ncbi:MAG: UxaA family hydrolase [Anaerolineae bacterium]|nr:UxaA family hydrolase [Anaerolineae bacterium]